MDILSTFKTLLDGISFIENKQNQKSDKQKKEKAEKVHAINSVRMAAISTKAYLYDLREKGSVSREIEKELSINWQTVAEQIHAYDLRLFEISNVKALGWADPSEWERLEKSVTTIKLDDIIKQCDFLIREIY